MITPEQTEQIKKQVIQQIDSTFPEDKKESAKNQIKAMNSEQFEEFLRQNNLIKQNTGEQKCIFCSIIFGDISSHKIEENEKAIAVLEINPISKGHSLIIPKEHISSKEKLPPETFSLAKEISKEIERKLKPKKVEISAANLFGHEMINILPIYENETLKSPRKPITPEELLGLQKFLEKKPLKKVPRRTIKKTKEKLWLPKRIP